MNDKQLTELERLAQAATAGPWKADIRGGCVAVYPANEEHVCLSGASEWAIHFKMGDQEEAGGTTFARLSQEAADNAAFIAAARTAVPELVEEVRRLRRFLSLACSEFSSTAVGPNEAVKWAQSVAEDGRRDKAEIERLKTKNGHLKTALDQIERLTIYAGSDPMVAIIARVAKDAKGGE